MGVFLVGEEGRYHKAKGEVNLNWKQDNEDAVLHTLGLSTSYKGTV